MTPITRQRNSRGEFTPIPREELAPSSNRLPSPGLQSPTVDYQVPAISGNGTASAGEQSQATKSNGFGTLVTMKRWKIAVTPNRAQVFLCFFTMLTRLLSMLSVALFWGCAVMCIKTFPNWNGPIDLFNGYVRRANAIQDGNPIEDGDNAWEDIFPAADTLNSYTVRLALNLTGHPMAANIREYSLPLLIGNPLVWAGMMIVAFCTYHFLAFIHGCLKQASRATRLITKHRST